MTKRHFQEERAVAEREKETSYITAYCAMEQKRLLQQQLSQCCAADLLWGEREATLEKTNLNA